MKWVRTSCVAFALAPLAVCSTTPVLAQPAPPTELIAQASAPGDLAISLFWIDNATNEDGFEIQRCSGDQCAGFETLDLTTLNNIGSYNDVGLLENTSYSYRVRAFNADGFSEFTNISTAHTSYARPIQVSNLQGSIAGGVVSLSWTDASNNETRFDVQRAEVGVSTAFEIIATLPPNSTTYSDRTALKGTSYIYRVQPSRFNVEGGAPDTVTLETGIGLLAPTNLQGKAKSRSSIELTWKGKFANRDTILVQWFDLNTATWETLAELPAKEKKFVDVGLDPATSYLYRIRVVGPTAVSPFEMVTATTR